LSADAKKEVKEKEKKKFTALSFTQEALDMSIFPIIVTYISAQEVW